MSNFSKILSALWGIMCLMVATVLMIVYANFPVLETWKLPPELGAFEFTKEGFFYSMALAFLFTNILYYLAVKLLDSLKSNVSPLPPYLRYERIRLALKVQVVGLNLFLVCLMIFMRMNASFQTSDGWYSWFFFIGPLIMIVGLIMMVRALFTRQ